MSTTIVASPLGRQLENTSEVIKLEIFVRDEDFVDTYDRLEVHRSTAGAGGPYKELTAELYRPARVPEFGGDVPSIPVVGADVTIVGLTLDLLVDESKEVDITFTGTDPLSYASAAAQVTAQGLGLVAAHVDALGFFVIDTVGVGVSSSLRVVGGDAASLLRLAIEEPDNFDIGRDIRINLLQGKSRYSFVDTFSTEDNHYKTRFRNSSSGAVSEFSQPFTVGSRVGVLPTDLAIGDIDLVGVDGKPWINQPVRVHTKFTGTVTNDKLVAGGDVVQTTDANGHAEFILVRGQRVTVSIPGTSLFRTITVPTDPTVERFHLWDPDVGEDDLFTVKIPDLIVAERRSL